MIRRVLLIVAGSVLVFLVILLALIVAPVRF